MGGGVVAAVEVGRENCVDAGEEEEDDEAVESLGLRCWGLGFRVYGEEEEDDEAIESLGFRVESLGFRLLKV